MAKAEVKKASKRETIEHQVSIKVIENVTPGMYLRQSIASGSDDKGRKIEIATTGPSIIISIGPEGKWPEGHKQYVVSVTEMAKAVLEALDKG